jgi:hypothetical protein
MTRAGFPRGKLKLLMRAELGVGDTDGLFAEVFP